MSADYEFFAIFDHYLGLASTCERHFIVPLSDLRVGKSLSSSVVTDESGGSLAVP